MKAVYVVIRNTHPTAKNMRVYAVCETKEQAFIARMMLSRALGCKKERFHSKQIIVNAVYPCTILQNDRVLMEFPEKIVLTQKTEANP
jgi:hypothetical protein